MTLWKTNTTASLSDRTKAKVAAEEKELFDQETPDEAMIPKIPGASS